MFLAAAESNLMDSRDSDSCQSPLRLGLPKIILRPGSSSGSPIGFLIDSGVNNAVAKLDKCCAHVCNCDSEVIFGKSISKFPRGVLNLTLARIYDAYDRTLKGLLFFDPNLDDPRVDTTSGN